MKKLMLMMIMIVLLVGTISATEFDDFKTYDTGEREYTITNYFGFGKEIATVQLISSNFFNTPRGYQRIAEFEIRNGEFNYANIIKGIELYDINDNEKEITRTVDYKYKTIVQVPKDVWTCQEDDGDNRTSEVCTKSQNGTKDKTVWEDWTNETLLKGENITIGVYTDVKKGDTIEWIVNIYGNERLTRWAIFNETINVGLVLSVPFNSTAGVDAVDYGSGGTNLTVVNIEDGDWGGTSLDFDGVDEMANTSSISSFLGGVEAITLAFNFTPRNVSAGSAVQMITDDAFDSAFRSNFEISITNSSFITNSGESSGGNGICSRDSPDTIAGGTTLVNGESHVLVLIINQSGQWAYLDGNFTSQTNCAATGTYRIAGGNITVGASGRTTPTAFFNGSIGDFNIWNRSLSVAEVNEVTGIINGSISTIQLNSPIDNFNTLNQTINFNGTINTGLFGVSNVSLFIDDILNETNSSQINNTAYLFTQTLSVATHTWLYQTCNTQNTCINSSARTLTISSFFTNNYNFNSSDFETAQQSFTVNITTNGTTPSNAKLIYNGTTFTEGVITSLGNDNFNLSRTITIPLGVGTTNFHFNFTMGEEFNTTTQNQIINLTDLTLCGLGQDTPFINITFRNETLSEENVNATIVSTWAYSLTALSEVNKTLSFTNASENLNYIFCATPNRSLNIQLDMNYDNSLSQQRSFSLTTALSNITLTQTLYLLPTTLGLFSPFKTITINGDTISFVSATITRVLNGNTITVANGLTDSSGFATFFLDPNILYGVTFSKTGFANNIFSFTPTADIRTVIMGGGVSPISNGTIISRGTAYTISPRATTLANNTIFTFTFNVTSNLTSITLISMNITNSSKHQLLFVSNAGVGNLSGTLDTSNNTKLFGSYIIQTDAETISVVRVWDIFTTFIGDYSIFRQLTLVTENDLISDFNRLLIVLSVMFAIVIFMSVGQLIESSESKIAVLLLLTWAFSLVGWLDTGLVVITSTPGINTLGALSSQYGIAILITGASIFFIFRRLFIRKPV